MKWLIVSTIGKNPGDEFIRCGIENLINYADKNCVIQVLDKETNDFNTRVDFDKCVWAGMPIFWSLNGNNNWNIKWWKHMVGEWPSNFKKKFCVLAAGSFQDWKDINRGVDRDGIALSARKLMQNSFFVTARDPVVNDICNTIFPTLVCPAILALLGVKKTDSIKGCNLMPDGGHYQTFCPSEAKEWLTIQGKIAGILKKNNFKFFAHSDGEKKHALDLGWKLNDIISYTGSPRQMLQSYRNVDQYFGNRVHGCIVSRGNGADVVSCGYDSRQEAVRLSGAKVFLPSSLDLSFLSNWASSPPSLKHFNLITLRDSYLKILNDFINA